MSVGKINSRLATREANTDDKQHNVSLLHLPYISYNNKTAIYYM